LVLLTLAVAVAALSLGVAETAALLPGIVGALLLVSALGAMFFARETRPSRRVLAAVGGAYLASLAIAAPASALAVAAMLAKPALLSLLLVPLAAGLAVGCEPATA